MGWIPESTRGLSEAMHIILSGVGTDPVRPVRCGRSSRRGPAGGAGSGRRAVPAGGVVFGG
ncbi:hypothetical protein GCM10022244_06230 [Streptomyces gulbargensis]|uniref:Uncharacterized protein n=1 Tax=Streptomyces gulbargensis TaxID=364901 RepID=A0ABP7LBR3_9ACTN